MLTPLSVGCRQGWRGVGGAGEELWSLDVGGAANQMLTAGANEKVGRRENSMCL